MIIDAMPYFRKWKLQPAKVPTAAEQWECTKLVLFSHVAVELPMVRLFNRVVDYTNLICLLCSRSFSSNPSLNTAEC